MPFWSTLIISLFGSALVSALVSSYFKRGQDDKAYGILRELGHAIEAASNYPQAHRRAAKAERQFGFKERKSLEEQLS